RKPPIPLVCVVGGISDPSEKYLERFCSDFSVDMVGVARSFLITSLVSNHKDIESTSQSCAQSPCEDHRRYSTIRMRATFHFIVVFLLWIVGLIFPMIKAGVESVYWQEFMKELPCSIDNSKSKKGWTIIRKKRKEMTKKQSKSSETYLSGQVVLKTKSMGFLKSCIFVIWAGMKQILPKKRGWASGVQSSDPRETKK
ncbi:hypothetical protein ADUPG1_007683, partial [Aduncisulcus paluster]